MHVRLAIQHVQVSLMSAHCSGDLTLTEFEAILSAFSTRWPGLGTLDRDFILEAERAEGESTTGRWPGSEVH